MNLAFGFNILILTGVEASILAKKNQKNCERYLSRSGIEGGF
jgi:hypothetical protein